jgi:succinoglycan biosynthesis protein ExoM
MQKDHVAVCVCTFKRPLLLQRLLLRLTEQICDASFDYSIVVVDNDAAASAQKVVERLWHSAQTPIEYVVEPRQNISHARNRALECARGDFVAFIDDDELPGPDWVLCLYQAYRRHGGDGVCGPVQPYFMAPMPFWLKGNPYFFKPWHAEGAWLSWWQVYTSNVFFSRRIFTQGVRFDARYGSSGGEDIMFFRSAQRRGYRFAWTSTAKVTELILPGKIGLPWVMARALRQGAVFARISVQGVSSVKQLFVIVESCAAAWFYTGLLFVATLAGPRVWVYMLGKFFSNIGKILGLIGYVPVEYDAKSDQ